MDFFQFCSSNNNGWEVVENTDEHASITHVQCGCKKNLQINVQPSTVINQLHQESHLLVIIFS